MNGALRGAQRHGHMYFVIPVVHVDNHRPAALGNEHVLSGISYFDQDAIGTVFESRDGSVNDRQVLP